MNKQRNLASLHGIGTLSTTGYAHPAARPQIERLMHRSGQRSRWERRLSNLTFHHQQREIELAEGHRQAVDQVASMLMQGTSLILLCACKDNRTCHRALVAKLVQDAVQARHVGVQV